VTRLTEPQVAGLREQRSALPGLRTAGPLAGIPTRPAKPRSRRQLSKTWLAFPVVAVAVGATLWYALGRRAARAEPEVKTFEIKRMSLPITLIARGEIKAKKNTEIRCEVEGRSTIVFLIEEGKQVKEGELLVELTNDGGGGSLSIDDRIKQQEIVVANAKAALEAAEKSHYIQLDLNDSNIRKAVLARDLAKLDLTQYVEGDYQQLKQTAQLGREEAEAILRRRQADLETSKQLVERGYITKTEHENDKFNAYKAGLELEKAKLAEEILDKYTHHRNLEQKKSAVEEAEKELERTRKSAEAQAAQSKAALEARQAEFGIQTGNLEKLRRQKENLKIRAPGPGMVVYHRSSPWDPQRIEVGASVHERQCLIDLPDSSVMLVEVKINESQMDKMDLDLPATIEVEGLPNVRFTGKLTKIGVLADAQNRWINPNLKEYTNEITLDQYHDDLKPGMSANVEILVKRLDEVLAVPVQCVFSKGGNSYVFTTNGRVEVKQVKLGLASTEYAQVLDGLKEGQKVFLAVTDDMKRMLPTEEGADRTDRGQSDKAWPASPAQKAKAPDAKAGPSSRPKPTSQTAGQAGLGSPGPGKNPAKTLDRMLGVPGKQPGRGHKTGS
jgi:HlyD family secretion protein